MFNNKIVEMLEALTAGEIYSTDLEIFKYLYGEKPIKPLKLEEIKEFAFWDNGQTVLIYNGRQIVYECIYNEIYGIKRLTSCF